MNDITKNDHNKQQFARFVYYMNNLINIQHWLDQSARISRQLKGSNDTHDLYFGVKFYAADPTKLIEEITR